MLIYVCFNSIALTSRNQRCNNDFPLTFAPVPIKEILPQLLKKQRFVFFVLLIVDVPIAICLGASSVAAILAAGQKLWRYVYEGLKKRGKRTFLAYAEMARVMAFDGQKLTVGVTTHTGRDRIDEPDFRNLLLDILKEATGRDLDLQVILAEEGSQALRREAPDRTAAPRSKVPPEMPAKPPETHSIPAAEPAALPQEEVRKAAASRNEAAARTETAPQEQEELPETVRKALQVFGGKIVPES